MNERVKAVRKSLNLTMEAFGMRIGVSKSTISNIEHGTRNVSDHMAKSICREFNVNPCWLANGTGSMFADIPQSALDELCQQYKLTNLERIILETYLSLDIEDRTVILNYMRKIADFAHADNTRARIDREVEAYRQQLELQASQVERSSALLSTNDA